MNWQNGVSWTSVSNLSDTMIGQVRNRLETYPTNAAAGKIS
jgi:hypothetical protein